MVDVNKLSSKSLITIVSCLCLVALFHSPKVHADAFSDASQANYADDMPQELPDNGNGKAPTSNQYFVLGGGNIDGNGGNQPGHAYTEMYFKVYTTHPNSSKDLNIKFVPRKVNTSGTTTSCKNYIHVSYANGQTLSEVSTQDVVASGNDQFCDSSTVTVPAAAFKNSNITAKDTAGNDHDRGVYVAMVMIQLDTKKQSEAAARNDPDIQIGKQASFSLRALYDAKLGYAGGEWINVYGTLNEPDHKFTFRWRPVCGIGTTDTVRFDEGDEGKSQTQKLNADVYTIINGARDKTYAGNFSETGGSLGGTYPTGPNGIRDVMGIVFDHMSGGNGFGVVPPQDTGNAFFKTCPDAPPAPDPSCSVYNGPLGDHSNYRFTTFSFNKDYVDHSKGPAENAKQSSMGGWKTFTEGSPEPQQFKQNTSDNDTTTSFNHGDPNGPDRLVYIERWHHVGSDWIYTSGTSYVQGCYTGDITKNPIGECDITITTGGVPGDPHGVQAGQPFTITGTLINTGKADLPENLSNTKLGLTVPAAGSWARTHMYTNRAVARGTSAPVAVDIAKAPDTRSAVTFSAYPDYDGKLALGPTCTTQINVYQRYDFTATAVTTLLPDQESPTFARHVTTLDQGTGVNVEGTSSRQFFKSRGGVFVRNTTYATQTETGDFGDRSYTDTVPVEGYNRLGDSHCTWIYLDKGHGWRGPGTLYSNEAPAIANTCGWPNEPRCDPTSNPNACGGTPTVSLVKNPYVRVYGGDTAAGGGFGTSCARTESKILAYLRPLSEQNASANRSGSGGQLAALALGDISGFTTASTRTTGAALPNGLTFAHNSTVPDQASATPLMGGNMTGDGWCAPDYYNATQFTSTDRKDVDASNAPITVNGLADKRQTVKNINGGKVRLNGNNAVPYTSHHTVYVDGDVYISGNIMYTNNWSAGIQSIPSFALIVKGNIIIDNDVTQLDGIYVAQPRAGVADSGRIYTCGLESLGDSAVTTSAGLFADCGANWETAGNPRQLKVNGALIAQRVILNRTGYSIGNSTFREPVGSSKAAEIINMTPEMYLSPPVFRADSTATSGDYDYIAILSSFL